MSLRAYFRMTKFPDSYNGLGFDNTLKEKNKI